MRRFIDVVFVHPKDRYYVVLHQGQFWQLPRMNLTASSWTFKIAYTGSLDDIFLAKNQALACQHLIKILNTYELPEQLIGMSASRFLDWWNMNDYRILSQKDVAVLTMPTADSPNADLPNTDTTTADTPNTNMGDTSSAISKAKQVAPKQANTDLLASTASAPDSALNKPALSDSSPLDSAPSNPDTRASQNTPPKPNTSSPKTTQSSDVFDDLLQQLNEEVMHHHG